MKPEEVEQLRELYRKPRNPKQKEQAHALLLARHGQNSYQEIAEIVDRSRATIQNWVKAFESQGLVWLNTPPVHTGRPSEMGDEKLHEALREGLKEGRWVTGVDIQAWLKKQYGLKRSLTTVYSGWEN